MSEKFMLRVKKGALVPADGFTEQRLREKHYAIGDVLAATLAKPRNAGFHRLVHQFGALLAENLDEFTNMDAHAVLKRLQLEAAIECDEILLQVQGHKFLHRQARSLSYGSMDEAQFRGVFSAMCRHVSATYWPDCSPDEIASMAEMMEGVA